MDETIQRIAIWVLPVILAITVHEVAHGWVAKLKGDSTAAMLGRLTLNPIKHIDPIGTLLVPGILLLMGGFIFGWAKPVPVNWRNLRNPKHDMAWVALAGPAANFLMALAWAAIIKLGIALQSEFASEPMILMGQAGITINLVLMILNLLPLPPLDGGRIMSSLLPAHLSQKYDKIEPYGFFILLGLMYTKILGMIMQTPLEALYPWILNLFGLGHG